ncbi:MAG TPA: hypothetical protein VN437_00065, partial [Rectinemataceae bacterium]|nr:hypothetical protein [Rectinemataceae bacterium]
MQNLRSSRGAIRRFAASRARKGRPSAPGKPRFLSGRGSVAALEKEARVVKEQWRLARKTGELDALFDLDSSAGVDDLLLDLLGFFLGDVL